MLSNPCGSHEYGKLVQMLPELVRNLHLNYIEILILGKLSL